MVVHDADELRTLIRLFKSEHEPTEMMEFWPDDVLALLDRNLELEGKLRDNSRNRVMRIK